MPSKRLHPGATAEPLQRAVFPVSDFPAFRRQLYRWAARFPYAQVLDNCQTTVDQHGQWELWCGVANESAPLCTTWEAFCQATRQPRQSALAGALGYGLYRQFFPRLAGQRLKPAPVRFPEVAFFAPRVILRIARTSIHRVEILAPRPEAILNEICALPPSEPQNRQNRLTQEFFANFSRGQYCRAVEQIRQWIANGDHYEANLSQCYQGRAALQAPVELQLKLTAESPVPFASFLRFGGRYLFCASPERFLQRKGNTLLSQPIKGTVPRGTNAIADQQLQNRLFASEKDRAENVMIVDLLRNDFNRICTPGSVQVPRLFQVQRFPQLHHLVSSITGRLPEHFPGGIPAILRAVFPTGSMTGAPKQRVIQRIAQLEQLERGLYAGATGYLSPNGDFDLNVVIRALQWESSSGKLAYNVGGAVTWDSSPEGEYEETQTKALALRQLFQK